MKHDGGERRDRRDRLGQEVEERQAELLSFFRAFGTEPVMIDSHDPGEILGAFLRWADLRMMVRGALV